MSCLVPGKERKKGSKEKEERIGTKAPSESSSSSADGFGCRSALLLDYRWTGDTVEQYSITAREFRFEIVWEWNRFRI